MTNEGKQVISVETKPEDSKKEGTDMWLRPYEDFERFIQSMLGHDWRKPVNWGLPAWSDFMGSPEARMPSVDVIDKDDHVLVRAEVPGIDKDNLNVSISENILTVKGETRHEEKTEKTDYFRHEISHGAFTRSVTLPVGVDTSKVNATLTDGLLEVKIEKAEKSKRRSVKVQ